jgi:hypothetical protein
MNINGMLAHALYESIDSLEEESLETGRGQGDLIEERASFISYNTPQTIKDWYDYIHMDIVFLELLTRLTRFSNLTPYIIKHFRNK